MRCITHSLIRPQEAWICWKLSCNRRIALALRIGHSVKINGDRTYSGPPQVFLSSAAASEFFILLDRAINYVPL